MGVIRSRLVLFLIGFLCPSIICFGQSKLEEIVEMYDNYHKKWLHNRVILRPIQNKFIPGDTVFFKAYFLDCQNKRIPGKQFLHLNLIDSKGSILKNILFKVTNGEGQNQLILPDSLNSGIYSLVSYSSWHLNFGQDSFFRTDITVVHKNKIIPVSTDFLKVFPEGGCLIDGVRSKVVIQTTIKEAEIGLFDSYGELIAQTISNLNGLSALEFVPNAGQAYYVKVASQNLKTPIGQVKKYGSSIRVNTYHKDFATISVSSKLAPNLDKGKLFMLIHAQCRIIWDSAFVVTQNGRIDIKIKKSTIPEGINHISLLNANKELIASRNFFNSCTNSINPKASVSNVDGRYVLNLTLTGAENQPIATGFSVKVMNESLDLVLGSSFEEEVSAIDLDSSNYNDLDYLMITTVKGVPWDWIVNKGSIEPKYDYTRLIKKKGVAYFNNNSEPLPDNTRIAFFLMKNQVRYETIALNSGNFWLITPDFYGTDELFYVAESSGKEITDITIDWEKYEVIEIDGAPVSKTTHQEDEYASFSHRNRLINRSYGFYTNNSDDSFNSTPQQNSKLPKPDSEIMLSDYTSFATMEEVVREILPRTFFRIRNKKKTIRVSLSKEMMLESTGDPLYIINGQATKSTELFLSLKPSDIAKIKIIVTSKKLKPLGLLGKNGVIIVETNKNDFRIENNYVQIEGLSLPISFKSYTKAEYLNKKIPEFRSVVFWEPELITEPDGKGRCSFYLSDDPSSFIVEIEGLTDEGVPFSTDCMIDPD